MVDGVVRVRYFSPEMQRYSVTIGPQSVSMDFKVQPCRAKSEPIEKMHPPPTETTDVQQMVVIPPADTYPPVTLGSRMRC